MSESKHELVAIPVTQAATTGTETQQRQRRQMLIALVILLLALILVLLKDWNFWFQPTSANPSTAELERSVITPEASAGSVQSPVKSVPLPKNKLMSATASSASEAVAPGIVASDRAVLPPLRVEVVSGRNRQPVRAASNSVRVDMQSESDAAPDSPGLAANSVGAAPPVVDAAETMHMSSDASQVVSRSVEPNYPLLAKQMKVQGAVVLQALIGRDGNIEDLRVLSGPTILSSAAMQAVRQWRFRPYYLSGDPVETQARITVNFTISTN